MDNASSPDAVGIGTPTEHAVVTEARRLWCYYAAERMKPMGKRLVASRLRAETKRGATFSIAAWADKYTDPVIENEMRAMLDRAASDPAYRAELETYLDAQQAARRPGTFSYPFHSINDLDGVPDLAQFAYNPQESRDFHGRWVAGAGGMAALRAQTSELPAQPPPLATGTPTMAQDARKPFGQNDYNAHGVSHVTGRLTADHVSPKAEKAVDAYYAGGGGLAEWAGEHQMSTDMYEGLAQIQLETLTRNAKLARRMSAENIPRLLSSGKYKNVFESGHVGGMQTKATYRQVEQQLWDYPQRGMDDTLRPIFGYLTDDPDTAVPDESYLNDYGQVTVVLKDSVRPRTTFAMHDTFGAISASYDMGEAYAAPVPLNAPTLRAYDHTSLDILKLDHIQDAEYVAEEPQKFGYAETQIHEGVSVDDIDYFVFETEPDASIIAQLEQYGKKWKVAKPRKKAQAQMSATQGTPSPHGDARAVFYIGRL